MASYMNASEAFVREKLDASTTSPIPQSLWADKYRGATVEDLDPPPALSVSPSTPISAALLAAFERDYTHLTVTSSTHRSLLGYLSIPRLKELLGAGTVKESDTVSAAMQRFNRKKGTYRVITMETPLEELQRFFEGENGEASEFAVVTDAERKFVLGVATKGDLEEFVRRRP
ncbi:putative cystathionine beta-synthase (beta-thionase) [Aspergillus undulatus]|uniref:putative cystathionine beta-synthase (beta-thionase) n=1 Tax=Aspergillus undulatus TaxID=1810928 RepID=UPI003CCE1893